ncbi:Vps4 oligomerization domain protein [Opisthorchis viverrini]|uniref:Vps4 oligomerization domain protein n=1 Tax=Opisthorchis viverrini TaxID=6198 RepID=A0A1S8XA95_OPIVI|nr:Vps4 oligomerization domain protein [Opisthorchis viverrini]
MNLISSQTKRKASADMANLCREAAMGPIRSLSLEAIQRIACDEVRPVVLADFESALNHVRASVSSGDLQHYLKWNKQYGSFDA